MNQSLKSIRVREFRRISILLLVITIVIGATNLRAQSIADSLIKEGDVVAAIAKYQQLNNGKNNDIYFLYNYTCALAISGQTDSAFKVLDLSIRIDSTVGLDMLTDPDLLNLHDDPRWANIEDKVIDAAVKRGHAAVMKRALAKSLYRMHSIDQAYYSDIQIAESRIGRKSTVVLDLWKLKNMRNEQNLKRLISMIDKYGWPKISEVGEKATTAAFLIIQHANIIYQKKYLPVIKSLCIQKEASWQDYALMYDRIQVSSRKPQLYGSQLSFNELTKKYEVSPIEDEQHVDERRKEFGMEPLADYLSNFGIVYKPK